ncbi:unnamed protein product [Colias eurytheme]|nr:unnamed protein product [Colias eurytheme]
MNPKMCCGECKKSISAAPLATWQRHAPGGSPRRWSARPAPIGRRRLLPRRATSLSRSPSFALAQRALMLRAHAQRDRNLAGLDVLSCELSVSKLPYIEN